MAGRQSYFAEKREQNPNYFNRAPIDEIRKNVRRIIRDVKNETISEQDYVYFTNNQVMNACLQEAYDNYVTSAAITNALNFYMSEGINKGVRMMPTIDLAMERIIVSNQQINYNIKAQLWYNLYMMFRDMYDNNVPAKDALKYVVMLSGRDMASL